MSGRIVKLLILLLIAGLISYVFYLNPTPVELSYAPSASRTLPLALVLIGTFFAGVLLTALVAFIIGMQLKLASWKVSRKAQQTIDHHALIGEARGELALDNFATSRALFQKIVTRDPGDLEARVLLAETYRREGDLNGALRVLEEARMEQRKNPELLLLAASINDEQGNYTAAYDNAALVYKTAPRNRQVLSRLVRYCRKLKRYPEAISYQEQLAKLLSDDAADQAREHLAELELEHALAEHRKNKTALRGALEEIIKRHKTFVPALAELAALDCDRLAFEEAGRNWLRAYEYSQDPQYLERIASMWIHADEPSKAVATVRNAVYPKGSKTEANPAAVIFYVNLLLRLEMLDDARKEFERLKALPLSTENLKTEHRLLKARLLQREGDIDKALDAALTTFEAGGLLPTRPALNLAVRQGPPPLKWTARVKEKLLLQDQPPATLSTP